MPKRFTDTDKWKKPFIRALQAPYKLLWIYICDDCDHAGIWQVDIDIAKIKIGEDVNTETAVRVFGDKIISFENGTKWFIPSFIEFQYGELNPLNRAHNSVVNILTKYNLINLSNKPLISPLQGDKDMVKDKDKELNTLHNQKNKEDIKENKIELPFNGKFLEKWEDWKIYKRNEHRFKYKTEQSETAALNQLVKLSGDNEAIAMQIIDESIANGWKGFFELKNNNNGKGTTFNGRNFKTGLPTKLDSGF